MNVKHRIYFPSLLFSFLEAALKRRPRAIEAEMKQLMSAQLKIHLAVYMVVVEPQPACVVVATSHLGLI